MSLSITVTGASALIEKLKGLSRAVEKRIINRAAQAALKPVVATARGRVPSGTGNLRKSIGTKRVKRTPRGEFVFLVGARRGFKWGDAGTGTEHDPMRYAGPVEFGHVLKVYGKSTDVFIAPAAFLRNAYNQHRATVVTDFAREVGARIDAYLGRGA